VSVILRGTTLREAGVDLGFSGWGVCAVVVIVRLGCNNMA
jgi:hypothetical protein